MARLVLGTRGSALALWQARWVAAELRAAHADLEVEERILETHGDRQQELPLGPDDRGAFVARIESALLDGEIDVAVHSMKDLPTVAPEGLVIAAVPPREDPRDALLTVEGQEVSTLPDGARVGTGSPRRRFQLLAVRPDLQIVPLRGNVDTRVRKLREGGELDAIVLAVAGLKRLGIDAVEVRPIDEDLCLPAVGQGALAVEVRDDDARARDRVAVLDNARSHAEVDAERACLARLGGGCLAPATAFARLDESGLLLRGRVGGVEGVEGIADAEGGDASEALAIGRRLAERMLEAGAAELLRRARQEG